MSQWKCHKWSVEDKKWKKNKGGRKINWEQVCERNGINKHTDGNNTNFSGCGKCCLENGCIAFVRACRSYGFTCVRLSN